MKCKWYADFEGVCTNDECPYRGDVCPTSEYPEVCKYAVEKKSKPELNAEELVAEKDAQKPERISSKDRLLEKKIVAHACIDKGQYQTVIISCVSYYNDGITFEGYSLDAIPLSELPKEDESHE